MRIKQIDVERYGIWQQLSLPLDGSNLQVIYGPNGAGKSTLLRFIRGVLYGYDHNGEYNHDELNTHYTSDNISGWIGSLQVQHKGKQLQIKRAGQSGSAGLLSVIGSESSSSTDDVMKRLLAETKQSVFEHIFAIDLLEMQELATLEVKDVADHIYAITLGPSGQKLLNASQQLSNRLKRLFNPNETDGELYEHLSAYDWATHIQQDLREEHANLITERDRLKSRQLEIRGKLLSADQQIRGHRLLNRIWEPWKRATEIREALKAIPEYRSFPENGDTELRQILADLKSAVKCRDALQREAAEFAEQAEKLKSDPSLRKHGKSIELLVGQRAWLEEQFQAIERLRTAKQQQQAMLDNAMQELGNRWSLSRLDAINPTPADHYRLLVSARKFEAAREQNDQMRNRIQQLTNKNQKRSALYDETIKTLNESSITDSLNAAKAKLANAESLTRLRLRKTELNFRRHGIHDELNRLETRDNLPSWVYLVLAFFGIGGLFCALQGIYYGVFVSAFGGLAYALLGFTCMGMAYALKQKFDDETQERIKNLYGEVRENESRIRETDLAMGRLTGLDISSLAQHNQSEQLIGQNTETTRAGTASDADYLKRLVGRIAELESLAQQEQQIQQSRKQVIEYRNQFRQLQQELATARQNWCAAIKQYGLDETIDVEQAFAIWERLMTALDARLKLQQITANLEERESIIAHLQNRIKTLALELNADPHQQPDTLLKQWEQQLHAMRHNREHRHTLLSNRKTRLQEALQYRDTIRDLKNRRKVFLQQAGVGSLEEYEQAARLIMQRKQLLEELAEHDAKLDELRQMEPELAIVEEQLCGFDSEENGLQIMQLEEDILEWEEEREELLEHLGRVNQQIEQLEQNRSATRARFEQLQLKQKTQQIVETTIATKLAGSIVDTMKGHYERSHQPAVLATASRLLEQLTEGKYRNVWTPLSEQTLIIEDHAGHNWEPGQLSGGTREQLFLAIRLAMVQEMSQCGVELPMVLDDVLVNFDQNRTESAIRTLMELANQGQQILLFTCHLHLAQLAESKGLKPIWLPHSQNLKPERQAG